MKNSDICFALGRAAPTDGGTACKMWRAGERKMGWLQTVIDDAAGFFSLGWVGSIIGIVGLAVALLAYLWTRQRGIIKYTQSG